MADTQQEIVFHPDMFSEELATIFRRRGVASELVAFLQAHRNQYLPGRSSSRNFDDPQAYLERLDEFLSSLEQVESAGGHNFPDMDDPEVARQVRYLIRGSGLPQEVEQDLLEDIPAFASKIQDGPNVDEVIQNPDEVEQWVLADDLDADADLDEERFYSVEEKLIRAATENPDQYLEAAVDFQERFSADRGAIFLNGFGREFSANDELAQQVLDNEDIWPKVRAAIAMPRREKQTETTGRSR